MRRLVAGVLAGVLTLAGTLLGVLGVAGPAQAAACSGGSGVTVVVDFGARSQTRCAPGDPSSGIAALQSAGFTITWVQGEAFVCRISGYPSSDPCQRTPPPSAYWSYWHANRGGHWVYSQKGATDYDPAPGTVDGWAFGSGKAPSTPPPGGSSTHPAPKPTASPRPTPKASASAPSRRKPHSSGGGTTSVTHRNSSTARSSGGAGGGPVASAGSPASTKAKNSGATAQGRHMRHPKRSSSDTPSARPSTQPSARSSAQAGKAQSGEMVPAQHSSDRSGSGSLSWVWGLLALGALAAAAITTLMRRRA